ncbi:MAG: hypothetical protein JWM16_3343 [Verrucomicrobiales bacterium]|nr:hypothetical protein [Verrucomicrobiales bacterium]
MRFYSTTLMLLVLVVFGSLDVKAASHGFLQTGSTNHTILADGTLYSSEWSSIFYDDHGNPIRSVTIISNYQSLAQSGLRTVSCVFDKHGELLNSVEEIDFGFDGTIDQRSVTTHYKLSETETRDIIESDWENDGMFDLTTTDTRTVDQQGRIVLDVQEQVYHAFRQTNVTVSSWVYIEDKDRLVVLGTFDYDGVGVGDSFIRSTELMNQKGQIVSVSNEIDFDGDGVIEGVDYDAFTYTRNGNLAEWTGTFSGDVESKFIFTFSYENRGAIHQQSRNENQALNLIQQRLRGAVTTKQWNAPFLKGPQ